MFEKYRPTAFETHPNHFVRLANVVKETPEAFASIRYLHSTFDAINKDTMHTFLAASKEENPVFLQIYGQSECGPMIWKNTALVPYQIQMLVKWASVCLDFPKRA